MLETMLDEGFLDYWRSLPLRGPLFPNVPLDTYDKRASKVTTECSIWLRHVVKLADPNKPFYSHWHTATSGKEIRTLGPLARQGRLSRRRNWLRGWNDGPGERFCSYPDRGSKTPSELSEKKILASSNRQPGATSHVKSRPPRPELIRD
jgi:hypothetical protein